MGVDSRCRTFGAEPFDTTFISCISGDGSKLPVEVILSAEAPLSAEDAKLLEEIGNNANFQQTEDGRCSQDSFSLWFKEWFVPEASAIVRKTLDLSEDANVGCLVLFVDSVTNISTEMIDFAMENEITIVSFPFYGRLLDHHIINVFKSRYLRRLEVFSSSNQAITQLRLVFLAYKSWLSSYNQRRSISFVLLRVVFQPF